MLFHEPHSIIQIVLSKIKSIVEGGEREGAELVIALIALLYYTVLYA